MGAVPEAAQPHPLSEAVDPQPTTDAVDPQPTTEATELQPANAVVSSAGGFSDAEADPIWKYGK